MAAISSAPTEDAKPSGGGKARMVRATPIAAARLEVRDRTVKSARMQIGAFPIQWRRRRSTVIHRRITAPMVEIADNHAKCTRLTILMDELTSLI